MAPSSAVTRARSDLGNHARWRPNDTDGLTERRRNLAAEKIADYIERTVAAAPPLSDEQVSRLTRLLRTS
ncbi:hypothetical protein GGQ55_002873 [Geodermatophilus daqingensis]|uniref:PhiRv1 phage protein n=1 Tax=Petropleomorpha daqingensis TaxID=2026353 RepID=A0A853CF28_9ACTN|nr:hypothetical protein [Petropleomorpha daqingensis]